MLYLENNTTFSGSDIKVYAYRDSSDFKNFKDLDERKVQQINFEDPFRGIERDDLDLLINESLSQVGSKHPETYSSVALPNGKTIEVLSSEVPAIQKQYVAPKFEDIPSKIEVRYADDSVKIFENEAAADIEMGNVMAQGSVATKTILENRVNVTHGDGRTETVSEDEAVEISASFTPPVVTEVKEKINYDKVQTNKVSSGYIDIIKSGSDKRALDVARKYQLAKQAAFQNNKVNADGSISTALKPIIELGSLYSITYSSFREKHAVRTLGRVSAKSYTRGQRTIAGSMNFAIFQSHELMDFLKVGPNKDQIVLLDQLPKFNLMLVMINEYGGASILHLFGVTISTESQQSSVEDLALMNNVTFYAEDIMTIENVGNIWETSLSMLHPTEIAAKTLRFYKKNEFTTLGSLMNINNSENGREFSKISSILNRSRGLF